MNKEKYKALYGKKYPKKYKAQKCFYYDIGYCTKYHCTCFKCFTNEP